MLLLVRAFLEEVALPCDFGANQLLAEMPNCNNKWMAPLDPLGLAWVWFSELVRSQVPCHPNFLMIFGKWTHASPRSIWNKFEINLSIPTLDWFWCIPSSVFCVVQPCRGLFFLRKTPLWRKNMIFHDFQMIFNQKINDESSFFQKLCFSQKQTPGRAAPHRSPDWGCTNPPHFQSKSIKSSNHRILEVGGRGGSL